MDLETLAAVLIGIAVYMAGLMSGAILVLHAHKTGAKLVDRIKHDQVPFEDDFEEAEIQTFTDGTFEAVE